MNKEEGNQGKMSEETQQHKTGIRADIAGVPDRVWMHMPMHKNSKFSVIIIQAEDH